MNKIFGKNKNEYLGWIISAMIIILIVGTIFLGRFFKSEEKIKLAFKNGQIMSFFVAAYNEKNIIKGAFILCFQPQRNRCAIISILPKTYILFGEHGYYTLEEALQKKVSYEDILISTSKLLDIKIDYYVFIKKENLIRLVDMIGGVEIFSEGIKRPSQKVYIPSGVTILDGDKTIEYLSFLIKKEDHYGYNQLKRIQNYIRGFLKLKINFLEQYNEQVVANYLYKTINTNMPVNDFLIFYNEIKERYKNEVKDYSKGLKTIILYCDKKNVSGYEYIFLPKKSGKWIKSEASEVVNSLEKDYEDIEVDNIVIEILNGTDIDGLAARAGYYLSTFGFDILSIGNAKDNDYENTIVIIQGSEQKAKKLADLIHCGRIVDSGVLDELENKKIDLTLILGRDFDGKVVR